MDLIEGITLLGTAIALYSVTIQRKDFESQILEIRNQTKEISNQNKELKKSAEANDKAQQALHKQAELKTLSTLLETERYLHEFNNKKELNSTKQAQYAAKNFEKIGEYQTSIKKLLEISTETV